MAIAATISRSARNTFAAFAATDVSCELKETYAMMSMDLAKAWPARAGIRSWQRALIYERSDNTAQLIELIDLDRAVDIDFSFITPKEPSLGAGWAQLGPVRMRYDGDLEAHADPIPVPPEMQKLWGETVYRLSLSTKAPLRQGKMTFCFTPLKTIE